MEFEKKNIYNKVINKIILENIILLYFIFIIYSISFLDLLIKYKYKLYHYFTN